MFQRVEEGLSVQVQPHHITPKEGVKPKEQSNVDSVYSYLQLPAGAAPVVKHDTRSPTGELKEATATSGAEVVSVYNTVQDEAQGQSRDNVKALTLPQRTRGPEQPTVSLYSTVQPVRTYPENLASTSSERIGKSYLAVENLSVNNDVKAIEGHRQDGVNSLTPEGPQHPVQAETETMYGTVQKPRAAARREHHLTDKEGNADVTKELQ